MLPLFALAYLVSSASARTFTVKNNCAYTVWPGVFTGAGSVRPSGPTGWEAPAGDVRTFTVDEGWQAGRIWPRTQCDFSTNPGTTSCVTGGCNGGLECDGTGAGVPPVTLAEWTLTDVSGLDWYDVSNVDGANVPIEVTNTAGCHVASCPIDLRPNCPAELQMKAPDGSVAGCKTACLANLDGTPADSPNCCTGSHSTQPTCPSSGVEFYDYFKSNCPNAYAFAFDEPSGTALFSCESNLKADYTVTFCP